MSLSHVLVTRILWALRMNRRSTPCERSHPSIKKAWGGTIDRGEGIVVVWRDLPLGIGERPRSHTPEPEDLKTPRSREVARDSSQEEPREQGSP